MSHRTILDNWNRFANGASNIVAGNSNITNTAAMQNEQRSDGLGFVTRCIMVGPKHNGIDTAKPSDDCSVTKHNGWLVLQRLRHTLGKSFTASSLFETKTEAEMYASAFDNIVAIVPIEWEE